MDETAMKSPPQPVRFTFRECLLLCLPALVFAISVRVMFIASIPEAYYGPDSNSYFETALGFWTKGKIKMNEKRRGLYPLLLIVAPKLPGNTSQVVSVVQHAAGVAVVLAIGWVAGHLTRRRKIWVPIVTCVAAVLPQPLWFEHEIVADFCVYAAFVATVALAFPTENLRGWRLFWFLVSAIVIVSLKPHGRVLWLGLMLAAAVNAGNPLRWSRKVSPVVLASAAAIAVSVALIFYVGSERLGGRLLLSSALPLVDTEGASYREFRTALKPFVENAKADIANYPFRQTDFKRPMGSKDPSGPLGEEWPKLFNDRKTFAKATKHLAMEGILRHPFTFAFFVMKKMGIVLAEEMEWLPMFQPKAFWEKQVEKNETRWEKRPAELKLVYKTDRDGYEKMVAERQSRAPRITERLFKAVQPFAWVQALWARGLKYPVLGPTWFAWLGFIGIASCVTPGRFRRAAFVLFSCALYMVMIFAVGDSVPRFLVPVEWIGVLFGAMGADWMLDGIQFAISRVRTART
jgi:hypothetical protein